jgi:hypothetical protein
MEISEMSSTRVINTNTIRQEEIELKKTRQLESNIQTLEYMAATGMFARYLSRGFRALNMGVSRFVFFPLILFFQAIELGLVANQARLENQIQGRVKSATLAKLAVEFLVFGATTAAIIGGMVAPVLFAVATPALLVAGIGLKALYDFGTSLFLFARSFRAANNDLEVRERKADRYAAGRKFLSGLANAAITVGLGLLAYTAAPLVATLFLGIGGTALGIAVSAMTKHRRSKVDVVVTPAASVDDAESVAALSTTAGLHRKLEVIYGLQAPKPVVTVIAAAPSSGILGRFGSRNAAAAAAPYATRPLLSSVTNEDVTISASQPGRR